MFFFVVLFLFFLFVFFCFLDFFLFFWCFLHFFGDVFYIYILKRGCHSSVVRALVAKAIFLGSIPRRQLRFFFTFYLCFYLDSLMEKVSFYRYYYELLKSLVISVVELFRQIPYVYSYDVHSAQGIFRTKLERSQII